MGRAGVKVAVFTSNQARHIALLDALVEAGHDVVATVEPKTWVTPETPALKEYWRRVDMAQRTVFKNLKMVRVPTWVVPAGELSKVDTIPIEIGQCPIWVVFSASFIRGWLLEEMLYKRAMNLHAGLSPEYRGSAPNFWASYDRREDLVGAQVQYLSAALDGGEIIAEYRPRAVGDPWLRSMEAVKGGIAEMVRMVNLRASLPLQDVKIPGVRDNNPRNLIRYAKHADFTEAIAAEYLAASR